MDKRAVIASFPNLANDDKFDITSPETPDYNCIAWAYQMYNNRWMQPPKGMYIPQLDAVSWWPDGVTEGVDISCLVEAFAKKGFEKCDTWEHEQGYVKVALYYDPSTNEWTHAARESRINNCWMSKLGPKNDIHHGSPYTIEGDAYGKVYCIMRMIDK